MPVAEVRERPIAQDHHTVGNVTYSDTNCDGLADREVTERADGSALVKEDSRLAGTYDRQCERAPGGTRGGLTAIWEPAPRMADIRAGSRAPQEWFLLGFPAAAVITVFAVPLLVVLAVVVLWRFTRTAAATQEAAEAAVTDGDTWEEPSRMTRMDE
jgi:hypothetical protein